MSIFEYDEEEEERKRREEERELRKAEYEAGIKIGLERGRLVGEQKIICLLKESGMSEKQISIITKINEETICQWLNKD